MSLATVVPRADSPHPGGRKPALDKQAVRADNACMRHVPTSLKLLAAFSLLCVLCFVGFFVHLYVGLVGCGCEVIAPRKIERKNLAQSK